MTALRRARLDTVLRVERIFDYAGSNGLPLFLFLFDHLSDRFLAGDPRLDETGDVWHVPVLLTYAALCPVAIVGEILVNASTREIVSHTPLSEMKGRVR